MAIRVALHHVTNYEYDREVALGPHTIRLRPAPHTRTPINSYSIRVTPSEHFENWQQDPQSNYLLRAVFPKKTRSLRVEVDLVADMTVINPFDFFLEPKAEAFPFKYEEWLERELRPFREQLVEGPLFAEYVKSMDISPRRTVDFLVAVNRRIQNDVKYLIRLEPGVQTCEQTLTKGSGSCRDSAWLMVQVLRHLGLAARFVSGYLLQLTPDVKSLDGPAGPSCDFTDLHAWTEVYLPGAGWIGLDPTSGLMAGEGHIPLAATPDPQSAAPIEGAVEKAEVDFTFEMKVTRVHEDPRVTKPYSEEQWQSIEALGHRVDADLKKDDVRLTIGGEPTFVSIDDMDGAEWNIDAVGPTKRRLAGDLLVRLRDRFGPGGVLHYGTGKWYPGESLPRWALSCFWRTDGEPAWSNLDLVARDGINYQHNEILAGSFMRELAAELGVNPDHAVSGHEDVWYYLWKERRLPVNVDPFDSKLSVEEDRVRLAKLFEQGLEKVVGWAIPLSKSDHGWGHEWQSGRWFFRPERMYLIPGDSPMGLRLPLDSLPWTVEVPGTAIEGIDPTAIPRTALAQRRRPSLGKDIATPDGDGHRISHQALPDAKGGAPGRSQPAIDLIRTALCVEAREGMLHVFMPPVRRADDYLDLVAAVENVATRMGTPVRIEGYTPPFDPRLNSLKVTPDPGVIEVNVHPAHSWDEQVNITTVVYEEARLSRLATEKFMMDGRHTGTGGGNHIVMGGATPADSPFLRRPDLLRSLIAYWNNHPSLSYLFSGLFVGPTSQAPRVDEARHDSIHELEVAFAQVPEGQSVAPWLTDRLLRNLLVDVTGNTHRAEFCIDKLYSPDHAAGRLGLVEFRGFEMPPHARMSLTQSLLLRALIARFWQQPYRAKLVRWGTQLHDRFMLPHFVGEDFRDVIDDVNEFGYPLRFEWFAPHFEFRFPVHGTVNYRSMEIELRQAIEPWNVLGEENAGGGASRFVDSSIERLQVKVRGAVDSRHMITCNGRFIPLHPTGVGGEFVAGVRFRAWQPPSCLHPTIGVHSPLVFDVYDDWRQRSIGGCTYHVTHPGGRSYDTFPVNANEAEARRVSRFFNMGHTPGPMAPPVEPIDREFPLTLDLRRAVR